MGFDIPDAFMGTLVNRLGPRLLLTIGPLIAACGFAMLAFIDFKQSYWVSVLPPMFLLGVGMAITVPPLTSTVMAAAGEAHAGIASGVNNAVARVAGLFAVAALVAVLFASFSLHLAGPERARQRCLECCDVGTAECQRGGNRGVRAIAAYYRAGDRELRRAWRPRRLAVDRERCTCSRGRGLRRPRGHWP